MNFGPWAIATTDVAEYRARCRALRAIATLCARKQTGFITALKRAEDDPAALVEAATLLDAMPSLTRRHVLAAHALIGTQP